MARRVTPAERATSAGQNSDMERSIAISAGTARRFTPASYVEVEPTCHSQSAAGGDQQP